MLLCWFPNICRIKHLRCFHGTSHSNNQIFLSKSQFLLLKNCAESRTLGNPFDLDVDQGPQIDEIQMKKILHYIDVGSKEGAKLVTGGRRHGEHGYFVEPTIFADVKSEMKIAQEEVANSVHDFN